VSNTSALTVVEPCMSCLLIAEFNSENEVNAALEPMPLRNVRRANFELMKVDLRSFGIRLLIRESGLYSTLYPADGGWQIVPVTEASLLCS
jgi:hypothetical protein